MTDAPRGPYAQQPYAAAAPAHQPVVLAVAQAPSSSWAVWSLVVGIVGVMVGWCTFGLPCLAAVVLGHIALADTKSGAKSGRGIGVAGLALGYVALVPVGAFIVWLLAVRGYGMVTPGYVSAP